MQTYQLTKTKDFSLFKYIVLIEMAFFILLFKQPSLGLAFFAVLGFLMFIFIFPEFSIAISFTGSVLLHIVYDYFGLNIPYFPLISHTLVMLVGLLVYFEKKCIHKEIQWNKLFYISVMIAALLLVGVVYSSDRTYGLNKTILFILINLPLLGITSLYVNDAKSIRNILFFIISIGTLLTVLSFIAAQDSVFFSSYRFRLSENIGPLGVARPLTFACVSLFFFLTSKNYIIKVMALTFIAFLIMPVIWSGSRGPLLGIFLSFAAFVILQPKIPLWQKIMILLLLVGVGIYYITSSSNQVSARIATPLSEEASAAFRVLAFYQAIMDFIANPITGIGTGSFLLDTSWIPLTYPHNLILELACENGIIGLLLIMAFLTLTVKYGFQAIKKFNIAQDHQKLQLTITMSALFINAVWNAMVSGHIASNVYVWLAAGFIWTLAQTEPKSALDTVE